MRRVAAASAARFARRAFASRGAGARALQVIDTHCGGEPARVVVGGLPRVPGATMMDMRAHVMAELDDLRLLLITEPRGYPCQNVDYVLPPSAAAGDRAAYGVVIGEQNKIYPAFSGHNLICTATALVETGMVPMVEPVTRFGLEAPAGVIEIEAACAGGKVTGVTLHNQPAFVAPNGLGVVVDVPHGVGRVELDVAFGGMWFAVVDAAALGLEIAPRHGKELCRLGEMIKTAAREQFPVEHPTLDYPGPDILCWRGPAQQDGGEDGGEGGEGGEGGAGGGARAKRARNTVVMSNGALDWDDPATWTAMLDRSPCGSGTCAVMACLHARGELALGERFVHEGIVGATFEGTLRGETTVGGLRAVLPSVTGRAWITQHCTVVVDPTDPFPTGFTVGDIWAS